MPWLVSRVNGMTSPSVRIMAARASGAILRCTFNDPFWERESRRLDNWPNREWLSAQVTSRCVTLEDIFRTLMASWRAPHRNPAFFSAGSNSSPPSWGIAICISRLFLRDVATRRVRLRDDNSATPLILILPAHHPAPN